MTTNKPVSFLEAIAREEGWLAHPPSRCRRNNNPGNIEDGAFARSAGATGTDGRFATFPFAATGFAAMRLLFRRPSYEGLTVEAAIARWAPPTENDTARYVANVCQWAACQPTDLISGLLDAPLSV
jgi:hypothetical protein